VDPPAAMPWLPAPISQSTCDATSLKSISPSFRNGVVIGGITPVGRAFMGLPSRFDSLVTGVSPLSGGAYRRSGQRSSCGIDTSGHRKRRANSACRHTLAQRCSLVDRQRLEIDNTTRAERNTIWGTSTGEPQCRRNASRSGSDDSDREYRGDLQMGRIDMIESLIVWLIIGAIAGWLAGQIVKGYGLGLVGNIVVGIIGAIIAGWLLPMIGF